MARLNDNLFTTLMERAWAQEGACLIETRYGWVRVAFSGTGLTELFFEDSKPARVSADHVFRESFLQWVSAFERLDAASRWTYFDLDGTDFQKSVWRRLLEIPFSERTSYGQVAVDVGRPKASRAVGTAVGANPVSLLIPCHRVLPSTGKSGNYRWGADRKLALLEAEQAPGAGLRDLF